MKWRAPALKAGAFFNEGTSLCQYGGDNLLMRLRSYPFRKKYVKYPYKTLHEI